MPLVVLPQQVFAVVVAVRRAHDGVYMRATGDPLARQRDGQLMIELDQDHRTLDAIVEHRIRPNVTHPGEPGLVQVRAHFIHADPRMRVILIANVLANELEEARALRGCQVARATTRMREAQVVIESLRWWFAIYFLAPSD